MTLRSIGDALIATDTEGRVTRMNPVAEELTGWPQDEAAGKPLAEVFRIVNEETRHTVENPVTKALREGTIVALANHTLLIRKDGSERAIDDSAAPIRDAIGGVIGVVLVFHDITERRRIEQAAQEALEYAENIVETVREPMLVLDGQLRVRTANDSFYFSFGVVKGETEGRLLYDLGNRQWDIPALRKLLEEILPRQSSFNDYEVAHEFESIGRRVMVLNARRVQRDHHDTGLILLAIEDITERRRLEEDRRELETRFTSLVKNIRDHSIFSLDPQGHVTSWNLEAEKILGYAEAEVLGQHFSIIFTPEDQEAGIPAQELAIATSEGRAEDERWHMRKNGERFWALGIVTPTQDASGAHTGFSKILRDMTDRKRAEEALGQSEQRLRRMVNIEGIGVLHFDGTGTLADANDTFLGMMGYSREEVTARKLTWRTMTPPEYVAVSEEQLLKLAATGRIGPYEKQYFRKDGSRSWMVFAGASLGDGTIGEYCVEINDRKQAEEALRLADKRKDEFLATLAHELRNPLAPIRNGLQLLKLTTDPTTWQQARGMMERQLGQMVRLVDDLLDISRITRNKLELRKAPVELWAVVQSAVETARPQIEANGHTLTVTLPPQPIHLDADLTRLAQVFWNLLNNSAKYTESGGRIALTAELKDGEAVVTVQDNGIGVPAESLPNLFEIFSQVDRSLERAQGGLGIGLALVKGLTEAHGGMVEALSEGVGQGCTFIVRLPVSEAKPTANGPQADAMQPAPKGRILVVDDNRDGAASLAMLLTVMGNDTRTAHDGLEGIELAEAFRPALIVLDIGLPKLNGYDACRRIREKEWAKDTLIVAATGWGQDEDRRRSKEAGFDHHLVKPVDAAELNRLLAERKS